MLITCLTYTRTFYPTPASPITGCSYRCQDQEFLFTATLPLYQATPITARTRTYSSIVTFPLCQCQDQEFLFTATLPLYQATPITARTRTYSPSSIITSSSPLPPFSCTRPHPSLPGPGLTPRHLSLQTDASDHKLQITKPPQY